MMGFGSVWISYHHVRFRYGGDMVGGDGLGAMIGVFLSGVWASTAE